MNEVRLVDVMQAVSEDVTALKGERDAANKKVESLQMALASLKEDQERLKVACLATLCKSQISMGLWLTSDAILLDLFAMICLSISRAGVMQGGRRRSACVPVRYPRFSCIEQRWHYAWGRRKPACLRVCIFPV